MARFNLTETLYFSLFKLKLFAESIDFRQAIKLQLELNDVARIQLRLKLPGARSLGYDSHVDELLHLSRVKLTSPEDFAHEWIPKPAPEVNEKEGMTHTRQAELARSIEGFNATTLQNRNAYFKHKEEVDDLVSVFLSDSENTDLVRDIHLTKAFAYKQSDNASQEKLSLAKAGAIDENFVAFDRQDIYRLRTIAKRKRRRLEKELRDREGLKLSISIAEIPKFLAIASALAFVSGFLYNSALLGYFGINTSVYFGLADHVPASLDAIKSGIFSTALAAFGIFLGMNSGTRRSYAEAAMTVDKPDYAMWVFCILALLMTAKTAWYGEFRNVRRICKIAYIYRPTAIGSFIRSSIFFRAATCHVTNLYLRCLRNEYDRKLMA